MIWWGKERKGIVRICSCTELGWMVIALSKLTNPFDVNAQHFDNPPYDLLYDYYHQSKNEHWTNNKRCFAYTQIMLLESFCLCAYNDVTGNYILYQTKMCEISVEFVTVLLDFIYSISMHRRTHKGLMNVLVLYTSNAKLQNLPLCRCCAACSCLRVCVWFFVITTVDQNST